MLLRCTTMKLVLFHKDYPHPFFEILGVVDQNRKLEVRPLWFRPHEEGLVYIVGRLAMKDAGYYPKEVDDAFIPELVRGF